jgi:glycosyltransferase involved in cell wall biosynthesis
MSGSPAAERDGVRFLFITVTDPSAASRRHLEGLLGSLEQQSGEIELVLVMRGGGRPPESPAAKIRIHPLKRPPVIGLSRARNDALAYARTQGLLSAVDVVAFPDDDCRYPDGLLARVAMLIERETEIVSGTYGPAADEVDHRRFPTEDMSLASALVMRASSSATVFFAARVVAMVGEFDERFGLGARFGAAEDADYVLRALRLGVNGRYRPLEVFVEHPYRPNRPSQYYTGNVAVLAKHALGGGTCLLLARRLLSGLVLVLRRMITPRDYARAVWATICFLVGSFSDRAPTARSK